MRRLLLSFSLVFAVAGMCGGGGGDDKVDDPVVVPVSDGDEEHWCCEYKDEDGSKQYALTDGPAECNTKYADDDGRWVSGSQCTPCCCKTREDAEDDESDWEYELTTPKSCVAASGECLAGDAKQCGGKPKPKPKPKAKPSTSKPQPRVVRPKR